jgi:hypothetical protein
MLAIRDTARHLEVEPAKAGALSTELDVVNWQRARVTFPVLGDRRQGNRLAVAAGSSLS